LNILIVHCHPEARSFNGSLKDVAIKLFKGQGDNVEVSDLYAENFDPVERPQNYSDRVDMERFDILSEQRNAFDNNALPIDIQREIKRLEKCDLLILQFPLWWHQQPAMLKGWFDRVFIAGGLYTSKMRYDKGYFKGKKAFCSVTSGAPFSTFTENGRGGGRIEDLLRAMNFSLHYMGFEVLPPYISTEIQNKGFTYKSPGQFESDLQDNLRDWERHLSQINEIKSLCFPGWSDWDEQGNEINA